MGETISASSAFIDHERALNALNHAQTSLVSQISRMRQGNWLTSVTISLVADQQEYALPGNISTIDRIELASGDFRNYQVDIVEFRDKEIWDSFPKISGDFRNSKVAIRGRNLFVLPSPSETQADAFRIWYYPKPIPMHWGALAAISVNGATTATSTLDSTPTEGIAFTQVDFYNEAEIHMTSGTESGVTQTITDTAASTRVITTGLWDVVPQSADTYEILSMLEQEDMELLVIDAIRRLAQLDDGMEAYGSKWGSERHRLAVAFRRLHGRRQTQNRKRVRIVEL